MSGGAYDYAFVNLWRFIESLDIDGDCCDYADPKLRAAFKEHLRKVHDAMHAIEWNDSGDGAPKEQDKIRACLTQQELEDLGKND